MGFPVGYSELPGLLLHAIFLLGHVRRLISWAFNTLGLGDLVDSDAPWPDPAAAGHHLHHQTHHLDQLDEILPIIRYDALALSGSPPESCAVCLHEIEGREEVRRLINCRHAFHRWCLDRWIGHGQRTCPLCRAPLFPGGASEWFYLEEHDSYPLLLPNQVHPTGFSSLL